MSYKRFFKNFIQDESGQSTTEYVLLLLFVVIAVKTVGKQLTTRLSTIMDAAMGKAEEEIKTAD